MGEDQARLYERVGGQAAALGVVEEVGQRREVVAKYGRSLGAWIIPVADRRIVLST